MKILLINPPRANELVGKNPAIIEKHRGFNPPLGLLYLAATINHNTQHTVHILDTQPRGFTYPELADHLKSKTYDVVGISSMTFTLIDAYKTVRLVKEVMPQTKVILGGTHVHLFPEETIKLDGVDFAFMGEAENALVEFLKDPLDASRYPNISGLVFKDGQGNIKKNEFSPIQNLDELPFLDRTLLDIKNYNSLLSRGSLSTTIVSSRGCPFRCAFCDRPLSPITSHFRYRSANNVVEEISQCRALGIEDFLFYDDTFTVNRKRVFEVCEEILKKNIKIRWDIRTRVDMVDKEMLILLKKAGCVAIHYGVEAGNNRMLELLKKGFTIEKVKEVFTLTKEVGIETLAYFMIGLPHEKNADIQDTFDLAKTLKPAYAHFTIFSPYPGTEFYYYGLGKNIIKGDIWREFARQPEEDFRIPVWEENFSRDELYGMIVKFYKSFYLRPSYLLARIMRIRSKDELIKKAKAGLSVLFMKKEGVDKLS